MRPVKKPKQSHLAGVIAGTPCDTQLGELLLNELGWDVTKTALSDAPQKQSAMQYNDPGLLQAICTEKIEHMQNQGAQFVLLYCSSLSAILDLDAIRKKIAIPVITPFDYYELLIPNYSSFATLAANALGLEGIEKEIRRQNLNAHVIGMHNLKLVSDIENCIDCNTIVEQNQIANFIKIAENTHCECIVLACTHFSEIKTAIQAQTTLSVLDVKTGLKNILADTELQITNRKVNY